MAFKMKGNPMQRNFGIGSAYKSNGPQDEMTDEEYRKFIESKYYKRKKDNERFRFMMDSMHESNKRNEPYGPEKEPPGGKWRIKPWRY